MNLSVIIAHHQEPQHLVATIRSIRQTAPVENVEIVVVDDGGFYPDHKPGESVLDFSKKENIRFIAIPDRRGNAFCRTLGSKHADGDWLMFTDAHMVFEPNWFERFCVHATADIEPKAVETPTLFCGPYLSSREEWEGVREPDVFYGARHYYWERGLSDGRAWDILGILPLPEPACTVGLGSWEVPAVIGANYFISKEWFNRIGGLQCQCGWSVDEWPLSVKTWLAGGAVRIMPDVRVRHILYRTGFGKDGYGKGMTQGQLLFNKLSVAYQTMPLEQYRRFVMNLPLASKSPDLEKALRLMDANQEQLNYWRAYLKTVLKHDTEWLCAKFDLNHPDDIGAEG